MNTKSHGNSLALSAVLLNPADSAEVGIVATLDVKLGSPRDTLSLRLRLDPDSRLLHETKAGRTGKVEEMFVEFNPAGCEVGRVTAFESQGVTIVQNVPLAAGAVTLSIIVRDTASGRIGSLTVPLEKAGGASSGK